MKLITVVLRSFLFIALACTNIVKPMVVSTGTTTRDEEKWFNVFTNDNAVQSAPHSSLNVSPTLRAQLSESEIVFAQTNSNELQTILPYLDLIAQKPSKEILTQELKTLNLQQLASVTTTAHSLAVKRLTRYGVEIFAHKVGKNIASTFTENSENAFEDVDALLSTLSPTMLTLTTEKMISLGKKWLLKRCKINPFNIQQSEYERHGVIFNPDCTQFAGGSMSENVYVFNTATGGQVLTLRHPNCYCTSALQFDNTGTRLITSANDRCIRAWDTTQGELLFKYVIPKTSSWQLLATPDGTKLIISKTTTENWEIPQEASEDWTIPKRNVETEISIFDMQKPRTSENAITHEPKKLKCTSNDEISDIQLAMGQLIIASGPKVIIYSLNEKKPVARLINRNQNEIISVTPSLDGKKFALAYADNRITIIDALSGKELFTLPQQKSAVRLVFSPDGTKLATYDAQKKVKIWNLSNKKLSHNTLPCDMQILAVKFSPNSEEFAIAMYKKISIYNIPTQSSYTVALPRNSMFTDDSIQFLTDSTHLAIGLDNGTVITYDLNPLLKLDDDLVHLTPKQALIFHAFITALENNEYVVSEAWNQHISLLPPAIQNIFNRYIKKTQKRKNVEQAHVHAPKKPKKTKNPFKKLFTRFHKK